LIKFIFFDKQFYISVDNFSSL